MKQLLYKIIYWGPANFILRNLNKSLFPKFNISPSGTLNVPIEGKTLFIVTNQTTPVTKEIFWNGINSYEYVPIFIQLVKRVNSFFDIGSNIGLYSLIAARINPNMKVVAFEPANGPNYYLLQNIKRNSFENIIKAEKVALSNKIGQIEFSEFFSPTYKYLKYSLSGIGSIADKSSDKRFRKYTVPTSTLNDYVRQNHIESLDLIKIDTEGTENLLLDFAKETLIKFKPIVICEVLYQQLESYFDTYFKELGFEFYVEHNTWLEKRETLIRKQDDGIRNCFFVHPEKLHLITDLIKK
ncbi:MAG: FkbM family methyltransferase [Opitutaceae bacterium]|nr:FkbM family methyltransferase [Cytophagales bacterium]